jgi:hypothetical protein
VNCGSVVYNCLFSKLRYFNDDCLMLEKLIDSELDSCLTLSMTKIVAVLVKRWAGVFQETVTISKCVRVG